MEDTDKLTDKKSVGSTTRALGKGSMRRHLKGTKKPDWRRVIRKRVTWAMTLKMRMAKGVDCVKEQRCKIHSLF